MFVIFLRCQVTFKNILRLLVSGLCCSLFYAWTEMFSVIGSVNIKHQHRDYSCCTERGRALSPNEVLTGNKFM